MSTWERLPVVSPHGGGCLNCPHPPNVLAPDRRIAVGFGYAALTKDGEVIWQEAQHDYEECMSVKEAEIDAAADPDHDWRIELRGPLHGEGYQRQGPSYWVCVSTDRGFA